jgi:sporulation protein YlmC with PRC-barrel domain
MVNLGRVKDLEVDTADMRVVSIIVDFEKEAAKKVLGKMIVLRHAKGSVPISSVESIKDALNLKSPLAELKDAFKAL